MQRIQALPPFSGLSEECQRELDSLAVGKTYAPGSLLFMEGQATDSVHVLTSGIVSVTRLLEDGRGVTLEILGPGSMIGEMGLFGRSGRSANIEALDAVTTVAFPAAAFAALMQRRAELAIRVAGILARRLRMANERIQDLAMLDARARVCSVLMHAAQNLGREARDGSVTIPFRMRHSDIAQLAGVSRETATRVAGALVDDHRIELRDGRIVLTAGWRTALRA